MSHECFYFSISFSIAEHADTGASSVKSCMTRQGHSEEMDRVVGLVTRGNPRLWVQILALAGSPRLLPGCCTVGCPLLQVCALGWVKCREHISFLIILCIIVYVTNEAYLSLICLYLKWTSRSVCVCVCVCVRFCDK